MDSSDSHYTHHTENLYHYRQRHTGNLTQEYWQSGC